MGCPTQVYLGGNLTFSICTHAADRREAVADADPTYRVYASGSAVPLLTGVLAAKDAGNTVGFYAQTIACTTANGFAADGVYTVKVRAIVDTDPGSISYDFCVTEDVDSQLAAIKLKTDTIGALSVTVSSPVATGGTITVLRGDDYLFVDGRQLAFVGTSWPVITGGVIALIVRFSTVASYAGVITGPAACYVELTDTITTPMTPGAYNYDLQATLASGSVITLVQGSFVVSEDAR